MKINRSTKCTLKYLTAFKAAKITDFMRAYAEYVNVCINYLWELPPVEKKEIIKSFMPTCSSWLSARAQQVACREAVDMVLAARERKSNKPVHHGKRIQATSQLVVIQNRQTSAFDLWLKLSSLGNKQIIWIPLKKHKHFNKLAACGKLASSVVITPHYIQFSFEIETGTKVKATAPARMIGLDAGIKSLLVSSNECHYGIDVEYDIDRINRCQHGSAHQKSLRRSLKQKMDYCVKQFFHNEQPELVVVERLRDLNRGTRKRKRLARKTRRTLGAWVYRYLLDRIQQYCEWNRVSFRSVHPAYTSQRCHVCGHTERRNRATQSMFQCRECDYTGNADFNAACNILARFITGPYSAGFKEVFEDGSP